MAGAEKDILDYIQDKITNIEKQQKEIERKLEQAMELLLIHNIPSQK